MKPTPIAPAARYYSSAILEHCAGRGGLPYRHCHRATAEGEELRAARGAVAGEALSIDRPRRRRPCRARSRARRFFADAGIPGDRGSANASRRARRDRRSEKRRRSASAPAATTDRYGQAMMLSRGFGARGNDGRLHPRPGACRRRRQCRRAIPHLLRAVGQ